MECTSLSLSKICKKLVGKEADGDILEVSGDNMPLPLYLSGPCSQVMPTSSPS